jgi:murein DD-endopeptidase MepM/ murein hydrolase activator NlpD
MRKTKKRIKNKSIIISNIILFLILLSCPAFAFKVKVSPKRIRPGDPFLVKVFSNPVIPVAAVNGKELVFSECGRGCYQALGALGVDAMPGKYKIEVTAGSKRKTRTLNVLRTEFPVQRLSLPEDKVFLSPEDQKRAEREAAAFRDIWNTVNPEKHWSGSFIMPLDNDFSTGFGVKRIMNGKKTSVHRGLDIRGSTGDKILAANKGTVVFVGDTFYGGNTVVIDHGLGVYTVYMHLSMVNVKDEEPVEKGSVVGYVGMTGRATGPHLHYGIKINAVTTNPVSVTRLPL